MNRQGKTRLAKYYIPLEDSEKHKLEFEFRTHKVIYRRYAGLFFSMCVDITDNELVYLESIHLFVEILDHFSSNVCGLDLVFNFHKVYLILDEFILAGELQATSKKVKSCCLVFVLDLQFPFSVLLKHIGSGSLETMLLCTHHIFLNRPAEKHSSAIDYLV